MSDYNFECLIDICYIINDNIRNIENIFEKSILQKIRDKESIKQLKGFKCLSNNSFTFNIVEKDGHYIDDRLIIDQIDINILKQNLMSFSLLINSFLDIVIKFVFQKYNKSCKYFPKPGFKPNSIIKNDIERKNKKIL